MMSKRILIVAAVLAAGIGGFAAFLAAKPPAKQLKQAAHSQVMPPTVPAHHSRAAQPAA